MEAVSEMSLWSGIKDHPVRAFALLCVAATSAFLAVMAWRLVNVLASPTWCSKAIQAERITPGTSFKGLDGCIDILKVQLSSLATNSHIVIGTFALCLGVLVVIVIAGARLAAQLPGGSKVDVSRQDAAAGAEHVEKAAIEAAEEVKDA